MQQRGLGDLNGISHVALMRRTERTAMTALLFGLEVVMGVVYELTTALPRFGGTCGDGAQYSYALEPPYGLIYTEGLQWQRNLLGMLSSESISHG